MHIISVGRIDFGRDYNVEFVKERPHTGFIDSVQCLKTLILKIVKDDVTKSTTFGQNKHNYYFCLKQI